MIVGWARLIYSCGRGGEEGEGRRERGGVKGEGRRSEGRGKEE